MRLVKAEATRLTTFVSTLGDLSTKANAARLHRSIQRFSKTAQARVERLGTANIWQVVMLVTCVEAYLQDLLSAAASVGPELMRESKPRVSYPDVIAANSLDELASELRARWARRWLSDGGPTHWISRLKKMGGRGYSPDLAVRLELIWGIRHLVVHAAGVANADFVDRHPGVVAAVGDRLRVSSGDFGAFLEAISGFLEPTEELFLARYPSLLAEESTRPTAAPSRPTRVTPRAKP